MNAFDLAFMIALVVAIFGGFATGLLRSAITILAYLLAMPIAVCVMSYVPPLDGQDASPFGHNIGFSLGAFLLIGMVLGKLARMMVNDIAGDELGVFDRLAGGMLGAVRVGLVATSLVLVFDQLIPAGQQQPSFLKGSQLRPIFSEAAQKGFRSLPPEVAAAIDRFKRERHI
jgi:membrane protein required for colicin V production